MQKALTGIRFTFEQASVKFSQFVESLNQREVFFARRPFFASNMETGHKKP